MSMKYIYDATEDRNGSKAFLILLQMVSKMRETGQTLPDILRDIDDERSRWISIGWSMRGLFDDMGK